MLPLAQLEVLVVDCQATAAGPRGHLLELGWARVRPADALSGTQRCEGGDIHVHARLIKLPERERIPPAVARITGIGTAMLRDGVDRQAAWRELSDDASRLSRQPAPTVAHFARFEEPFLRSLAGGVPPLDIVCTHEIARRLLPDLPRCGLRALAGYFGGGVGALRRSADHVTATAFVWRELVRLLEVEGVSTWSELRAWIATPAGRTKRPGRVWPMPRDVRLSLPDAPGVYRLLRTSGDVLYVGKASSLRHRVNSYFRKQHGVPERMLEMLSQVRAVSFEITPSALEAALLEPDEIKRLRPPYNVALTDDRDLWFTPPDLSSRSRGASPRCQVGPFPSAQTLDQFAALAHASRTALGDGRWAPDPAIFSAGYARLRAEHPELSCDALGAHSRFLRLGNRLWREGRRDCDGVTDDAVAMERHATIWTAEQVQFSLERLALRAALARRRARWLTRLVDAAVVWSEPGVEGARLIVIERGEITLRGAVDSLVTPPLPPGHARPVAARHEMFTVARFDRLRVLTTELKRLSSEGAPVALRWGVSPVLTGDELAYALSWV
jgi:DNA polymerase-3 subunit epsilon